MRKKLIGFVALLSSLVLCAGCFGSGNDSGSSSSSNSIESEQSGNSSSDITDDSSSDDSSSDDSSSDDSSSDDSSSDDSSSDDSGSDDSSSDDSSSDDSGSDDSSSDDNSSDDSSSDDSSSDDSSSDDSSSNDNSSDDSSSDDSSLDDSSSDDSSSDDSSSDDSSSDDSSSDDSSSDDSSSDDSSSDDSSSDDIVDDNKYAIGTEIYTGATMTKDGDTITYTANETIGAQIFKDVELAQGTDFVVYATVASGMTAQNVGFVVGTLGEDNANHLLFQWRKSQEDFYVWKNLGGWAGHNDKVFNSSIGTEGAEIALVYKNGTYYAFLNGEQVCYFKDAFDDGWGKLMNVNDLIGTDGTLKIGLSVAYGTAQFTEWGYSTDAEVIKGYVADEPVTPPVEERDDWTPVFKGEGAYCKEDETKVEINNGGYLIEDAVITNWTSDVSNSANWPNGGPGQNEAFEASTTVEANAAATQIGFALTADGASRLQIVYNVETGRIRVTDGTLHREYNATEGLYKADQSNTFTIKYDGSVWVEFLINGTSAITNGWDGKYIHLRWGYDGENSSLVGDVKAWHSFGTGDTLKVGLVAMHGNAIFTDWSFTIVEDEPVVPPVEPDPPVVEPEVRDDWAPVFKGEGAYCEETENQVEIKNGGYLLEGAEIANWNNGNGGNVAANGDNWVNGGKQMNTKFSVSAKIQANAEENYKVGFIFTLNGTDYFAVVYNNEEKEIRVQASNGHYRDYGLGDTFDPAGTTMTLEYDGIQGMLLYFGEGENKKLVDLKNAFTAGTVIFRFGYTQAADGGFGDNEHITVALKESSGTLKVGLIAMDGTVTFTGWNFAAETVEPETPPVEPETPPVVEPETPVIPEELVLTNENRYLYEVANWNNGNGGNVAANGDNWVNGGKQMNTKFTISAKIQANAEENYQVGFAFTLNGTDYFTVVYKNEEKEIRVQASNGHYRDYGLGDTFDPAGTTMTLEYDGVQGLILYFGEGENKTVADLKNAWSLSAGPGIIFRYGYTQAADGGFGDNEHITVALKESSGTLKVGFAATGTATFTDLSFSTENVL